MGIQDNASRIKPRNQRRKTLRIWRDKPDFADPNPATRIGCIRTALMRLIEEHRRYGAIPTSGRFLFYELEHRGIISKEQRGARRPDQDMTVALTDLRERGHIGWDEIVDETRSLSDNSGSDTVADDWLAYLYLASIDPWNSNVPFIITESRSLAGVLRSLAREYRVRIAATNGQTSGFLRTRVAKVLNPGDRIGYLGDFDLCGSDIEANTRQVLEEVVGELNWCRLALTAEQVEQYSLPAIAKTDRRFKDGAGIHEAVETEALSQTLIVSIVRDWLDNLLPVSLADVREREGAERERLRALVGGVS